MTGEWRDVPVLVTGAGGFIGGHLSEALVGAGARVRAFAHYNSRGDWGALDGLDDDVRDGIEIVTGDIRDPFLVQGLCEGVDVVFHLAALVPIPYSYRAPAEYVDTNVKGTLHILEAVRRSGVKRVVHTSTSEVYGTARSVPIAETHPLQAQSPYAASKVGADKLAEAYHLSFGVPVVTVRPFNAYGPRQSARAFLPSIIAQALTGDEVRVGSLDPVRDMNHVSDIAAGFMAAGRAPGVEGLALNLGSGRGVRMGELLDLVLRVTGKRVRVVHDDARVRPEHSEVLELVCDASLAADRLKWSPRMSLEDGVRRTADWIAAHLDRYKPGVYNI